MIKGRMYDPVDEGWLMKDRESITTDESKAGIFTRDDWLNWGQFAEMDFVELPVDQQLRLDGQPQLPGLELL